MRIIRVDIENFRCIKQFEWHPHAGQNTLIGPSNCGKSTVIEALRLLLSPEYTRLGEETFTHFDVHNLARAPGGSQEHAVRIGASLGLAEEEWQSFPELDEPKNTELLSWAPAEQYESTAALDERDSMLRVALFYEWDRPDPDDRAVAFFPKFGTPTSQDCQRLGIRHREALGFWVAPYNDPLWQIASLSRRSHLSRAAQAEGLDLYGPDGVPKFLTDLIEKTHQLADQADWSQLRGLSTAIAQRMRAVLPAAELPDLGVTAALTDAWVQRMLELGLNCGPEGQPARIPVSRQGVGTQRAFMIAAHAVCQERRRAKGSHKPAKDEQKAQAPAGCIAVDEPEVGLHPQAQRALLQALRGGEPACQLFVATHSPAVVEWSDPQSVWLLSNTQGTAKPMHLPRRLGSEKDEQIRKNADRFWPQIAPALFARAALIVEGSTEAGAIPVFDREWARDVLDGYAGLDGHDIAFVAADGISNIAPIARVLKHFDRAPIALHDSDPDGRQRHDDIEEAADFVLRMPDEEDARDFECMMALDLTPEVLEAILIEWGEVYDASERTFRQWVLNGLQSQPDLRSAIEQATTSDEQIPQCLGGLLGASEYCEAVRGWFLGRCKVKSGSDTQNIFGKRARYARIWARACMKHGAIPTGISDLFSQITEFVKAGYKPPDGRKVHVLKLRPTG